MEEPEIEAETNETSSAPTLELTFRSLKVLSPLSEMVSAPAPPSISTLLNAAPERDAEPPQSLPILLAARIWSLPAPPAKVEADTVVS